MSHGIAALDLRNVRATDSNSLLRLYDAANRVVRTSGLQEERARATRMIERITKELQRRKVSLGSVIGTSSQE